MLHDRDSSIFNMMVQIVCVQMLLTLDRFPWLIKEFSLPLKQNFSLYKQSTIYEYLWQYILHTVYTQIEMFVSINTGY